MKYLKLTGLFLINVLDVILATLINWTLGLLLFLLFTSLSLISVLVGGKSGLIDFYKKLQNIENVLKPNKK